MSTPIVQNKQKPLLVYAMSWSIFLLWLYLKIKKTEEK